MAVRQPFSRRDALLFGAGSLATAALPGMAIAAPAGDGPAGLRQALAGRRIRFGAGLDLADISRPDMVALFKQHCTSLTPRNTIKWPVTEPREGQVNYAPADRIVAFARSIGCSVYGHTLIWYRVPGWVDAITDADILKKAMRRRIGGAVGHFGQDIYAWDVVNEPMEYDAPKWRDSVFQRLLGEDHIRASFDWAHEANPKAELVLNETHLEKAGAMYDARRALLLGLVERLKAKGVPLHSVGLQAHFRPGLDRLDPDALGRFCAALKKMGVAVRITELDGSCRFVSRLPKQKPDDLYAAAFSDVIRVAAESGDLKGVTIWGMAEKYSGPERGASGACRARVMPFDDDMTARPAFDALAQTLKSLP